MLPASEAILYSTAINMKKIPALTESDLEALFSERKATSSLFAKILKILFLFTGIYLIIFLSLNFQGLKSNLYYWYRTEYLAQPFTDNTRGQSVDSEAGNSDAKSDNAPIVNGLSDNHIKIEAIKIDAPIIWGVKNDESSVRQALQNGAIQIAGTALPGQNGNIFITGHSSDLLWAKGNYKTVFALLNKLVVGDLIQLKYHDTEYSYKVSEIKVVQPTDASVLDQTKDPILTLATCTPIGTTLRRLIVVAKQIQPEPNKNQTAPTQDVKQPVPKIR